MRKCRRDIIVVRNEIDYDKLAEALIKVQISLKERKNNTGKFRSAAMSVFNGIFYAIVYIIAISYIYLIWTENHLQETLSIIGRIVASIFLIFIGTYAFLCQQESLGDKDCDAREHFNINISLLALIVAIIALTKGVQ